MTPDTAPDSPVLIAYDGSEHAKAAIEQAGAQLRTPRAAIVLAVYEPLEALPFWGVAYGRVPTGFAEEAERQANDVALEGADLAKEAGFDAKAGVIESSPVWKGIIEAAKDRGAGMIVMGSHGRSGVSYVAMGSVATAVAHHAAVPVLICRAVGE
jgi:nucleotide-binding universal stress UspA family protein